MGLAIELSIVLWSRMAVVLSMIYKYMTTRELAYHDKAVGLGQPCATKK